MEQQELIEVLKKNYTEDIIQEWFVQYGHNEGVLPEYFKPKTVSTFFKRMSITDIVNDMFSIEDFSKLNILDVIKNINQFILFLTNKLNIEKEEPSCIDIKEIEIVCQKCKKEKSAIPKWIEAGQVLCPICNEKTAIILTQK